MRDADARGQPIGRRIVLGSIGLGALGVLVGARVQSTTARWLLPVTLHDPTGLSDLHPGGGPLPHLLGHRLAPAPQRRRLPAAGRRRRRPPGDVHAWPTSAPACPRRRCRRDFQCVTGWRVEGVDWAGVRLRDVLAVAGVQPAATHVVLHSFDGTYTETLSMDQARRDDVLVAHTLQGDPLEPPARRSRPPLRGARCTATSRSSGWTRIEVVTRLDDDIGYWEQRGFDRDAWVGSSNGGHEDPT